MAERKDEFRGNTLIKSIVNDRPPPPPPVSAGGRPLPPKAPPRAGKPAALGGK
jgi:hypothetical protein